MCFSLPPNRPHSCLLSSYSGRHSSDMTGAKAVGWLPVSDGKLLLMSLGSLPRFGIIGLKKKRGERGWGGGAEMGPFSTLCDSGICSCRDLRSFPSPFSSCSLHLLLSFFLTLSPPPFAPPPAYPLGSKSGDHPELRSKAFTTSTHRWILTACTIFNLTPPP